VVRGGLGRVRPVRPLEPVTDGVRRGHLDALAEVEDPRDPRGVRYPLACLFAVAVCAATAGAVTFAALSHWLQDLPDGHLQDLGPDRRPVATTLWRLLVRVEATGLGRVLSRRLVARGPRPDTGRSRWTARR
jgi:hypothetical protein